MMRFFSNSVNIDELLTGEGPKPYYTDDQAISDSESLNTENDYEVMIGQGGRSPRSAEEAER